MTWIDMCISCRADTEYKDLTHLTYWTVMIFRAINICFLQVICNSTVLQSVNIEHALVLFFLSNVKSLYD